MIKRGELHAHPSGCVWDRWKGCAVVLPAPLLLLFGIDDLKFCHPCLGVGLLVLPFPICTSLQIIEMEELPHLQLLDSQIASAVANQRC